MLDNRSTDRTAEFATFAGAEVVTHERDLGIGGSLRRGYIICYIRAYERVVQLDAGGSHEPADMDRMLEASADLVIGSRLMRGSVFEQSFPRKALTRLASVLLALVMHRFPQDYTSGYRCFSRKLMEVIACDILPLMKSTEHAFTTELLVWISRFGFSIGFTPIHYTASTTTLTPR